MTTNNQWPVGRTITGMRRLAIDELDEMMWNGPAYALMLDDGSLLFASSDEEGNDAGVLLIKSVQGDIFQVTQVEEES
jgi:hypothetical protein